MSKRFTRSPVCMGIFVDAGSVHTGGNQFCFKIIVVGGSDSRRHNLPYVPRSTGDDHRSVHFRSLECRSALQQQFSFRVSPLDENGNHASDLLPQSASGNTPLKVHQDVSPLLGRFRGNPGRKPRGPGARFWREDEHSRVVKPNPCGEKDQLPEIRFRLAGKPDHETRAQGDTGDERPDTLDPFLHFESAGPPAHRLKHLRYTVLNRNIEVRDDLA